MAYLHCMVIPSKIQDFLHFKLLIVEKDAMNHSICLQRKLVTQLCKNPPDVTFTFKTTNQKLFGKIFFSDSEPISVPVFQNVIGKAQFKVALKVMVRLEHEGEKYIGGPLKTYSILRILKISLIRVCLKLRHHQGC